MVNTLLNGKVDLQWIYFNVVYRCFKILIVILSVILFVCV